MSRSHVIKIDSPTITTNDLNYALPSFPPPADFPMVVSSEGVVISRYGDAVWDYSELAGQFMSVSFGDGPRVHTARRLDAGNAELFRRVAAYLQYGSRPVVKVASLCASAKLLKVVFRLCMQHSILASDLSRFPSVAEKLPRLLKSKAAIFVPLLYELYNARDLLGFVILDVAGLKRLAGALVPHERSQTPYIPARIWTYQVDRLRKMLQDYLVNQAQFEALFSYCLDAHVSNYGSLDAVWEGRRRRSPFAKESSRSTVAGYVGTFAEVAKRFGVDKIIERWAMPNGRRLGQRWNEGARPFSTYLSAIGYVGSIYIANFSGMRQSEVARLRTDCLIRDRDEGLGDIYMLRGETTKTVEDSRALWITSSTCRLAVDAMTSVARMRCRAAAATSLTRVSAEDIANPYLIQRAYEPWGFVTRRALQSPSTIRAVINYADWREACPGLFEGPEITINEEDLRLALLVTPSLDKTRFAVGKVWPFAMHQLRRTLVVNATHSGLVSHPSIQYEMKHQAPAMSLYYGQGYSRVQVNRVLREDYVREMYVALGLKAVALLGPDFASPLGEKHKARLLQFIGSKSLKELSDMAEKGKISIRETLLGVCMNRDYCEYGGVDHLVECVSCDKALVHTRNRVLLERANLIIDAQLLDAPTGTALRASLEAQRRAVKETIDVITFRELAPDRSR